MQHCAYIYLLGVVCVFFGGGQSALPAAKHSPARHFFADEGMRLTCHFCSGHSKSNPKRYFYRCRNGTCVQARSEGQNARQGLAVCDREACVDLLLNYFNANCPKCASVCCCVKDSSGKWYHRCVDHQLPECPCKNKRKQPDSRGVVDIASAQKVEAQRTGTGPDGTDTESVRQTFSRMSNSHLPSPAFGHAPTPSSAIGSFAHLGGGSAGQHLPTFGASIGDPAGSRKRRAGAPLDDSAPPPSIGAGAGGGGGDALRHIPGLGGIFGDEAPSRRGSNLSDGDGDASAGLRAEVATLREFVQNMAGNLHHLTQHQDATLLGVRRISSDIHGLSDRLAALEISEAAKPRSSASGNPHGSHSEQEPAVDSEHVARVQAFNHQISKIMSHVHGYFNLRQAVDVALDDSALATVQRGTLASMGGKLQTLHSRLGRLRAILASGGNKFAGAFMDLADLTRWQSLVFAEIAWLDQVKTLHAQQAAGASVAAGTSGQGTLGLPSAASTAGFGTTGTPQLTAYNIRPQQQQQQQQQPLSIGSGQASRHPRAVGVGGGSGSSSHPPSAVPVAASAPALPSKPGSQSGRTNSEADLVGMGSIGAPQSYAEGGNFGLNEDDDLDLTDGGLDFGLGGGGGAQDRSRDIFSFEGDGDDAAHGAGGAAPLRSAGGSGGETPVPQQASAHGQGEAWTGTGRGPASSFDSAVDNGFQAPGGPMAFLRREASGASSAAAGGRERARSGMSSGSGGVGGPLLEPPRQSFL